MKKLHRLILILLFILPFVAGGVGYRLTGDGWLDALYQAGGMYFFNAASKNNNFLVEFSRWMAPVVMISGVVIILQEAFIKVKHFIIGFWPDAVAVYGNTHFDEIIKSKIKHVILAKDGIVRDVARHMIMFPTDEESIGFYTQNKKAFAGKEVYIKLSSNDGFNFTLDNVRFFNLNEIVARNYWQQNNLARLGENDHMKIAIIGSGPLARKIMIYGVLNNIYSLTQKIEYYVWGENTLFEGLHSDFEFMNEDAITFCSDSVEENIKCIASADRIILTEETDMDIISGLCEISKARIDYFDPTGTFVNVFGYDKLNTFGNYEEILTLENIRTDNLYRFAKELNYKYAVMYGDGLETRDKKTAVDEEWERLNAFTKGSNIASGDYHSIRLDVMKQKGKTDVDSELAELEHIRWCRYHFLNHWKYGETPDGKKNAAEKIHPCLVEFDKLTEQDKQKDVEAVKVLLELKND